MNRRVHIFIDASNLWEAQKTKGYLIDIKALIAYLKERYKAADIQVFYYTAYPASGTRNYDTTAKHRFYTFLEKKLGIVVRKKPLKRIAAENSKFSDGLVEKGNMDVELAIDAVHNVDKYDTAVLFTGDSDFLALVKFIRSRDKKVYIYSSRNNVSSELRTGGDGYVDILSVDSGIWGKEMYYREQKHKK